MENKSILVIDTPKDCYECPCSNEGCYLCQISRRQLEDDFQDTRPKWCPLRPLPLKGTMENVDECEYNRGFVDGRNHCIELITGETE